jgi:hypothetical protein
MNKFFVLFGLCFFLVGSCFFVIGVGSYYTTKDFIDKSQETKGKVIENSPVRTRDTSNGTVRYVILYESKVEYKVGNEAFLINSNVLSNPPEFSIGDEISVFYDPKTPQKGMINSDSELWFLSIIFASMGFIFAAIGAGFLVYQIINARNKKWLISNGRPVLAKVIGVHYKTNIKFNGRSPWVIEAQWLSPMGQMFVFNSEYLWFDPTELLQGRLEIDVLINPNKPKMHFMKLPDEIIRAAA